MVSRLHSRRGASRLGCLLVLLAIVAVAYWGIPAGNMWLRYVRIRDEMQTQARFAPSIDDDTIRRRIVQRANELGLPIEAAGRLLIRRTSSPREIRISTRYEEILELPFRSTVITLEPAVRQPL